VDAFGRRRTADFQEWIVREAAERIRRAKVQPKRSSERVPCPPDLRDEFGYGAVWTWTAIDADTKLVPCWMVGDRSAHAANTFIEDLASRLSGRIQLTTDGHKVYVEAAESAFGSQIDYAMLIKLFGEDQNAEKRYSPARCTGTRMVEISGTPDSKYISTSYVERQNLTMRMHMRRFARLTNAFSKKLENHISAISLHFMYYSFCRIHQTLRVTPAMAADVTDRAWEVEDIVNLTH
jgi:IS1 family transposase